MTLDNAVCVSHDDNAPRKYESNSSRHLGLSKLQDQLNSDVLLLQPV